MKKVLLLLCCWLTALGLSAVTDSNDVHYVYYDGTFSKPMVWAWNSSGNCTTASDFNSGDYMVKKDGMWYWELPAGKSLPTEIIIHEGDNRIGGGNLVYHDKATYHQDGKYTEYTDPAFDPNDCYIFFDNSVSKWSDVGVWAWNSSSNCNSNGTWPGDKMEKRSDGLYQWKLPAGKSAPSEIKFNNYNTNDNKETGSFAFVNKATYTSNGSQGVNESLSFEDNSDPDDPDEPVIPDPEYPATLYLIGNVNDWLPNTSIAATGENGVYKWNNVTLKAAEKDTYSYFTFVTVQSEYWNKDQNGAGNPDGINEHDRYGATEKDAELTASAKIQKFTPNKDASSANSWKVAAAKYDVVADLVNMTVTITKTGEIEIEDPDPVIPDDPTEDVIVYVKGLDAANIYYYADGVEDIGWDNAPAMKKDTATGYLMFTLPQEFHNCSVIIRYNNKNSQWPASQQPGKEVNGKSMILDWDTKSWTEYTGGNGGDDPEISGMKPTGTLPVLYINVCEYTLGVDDKGEEVVNYTRDENGDLIYINEIIDRNLKHKDYFNHAQYWIDANGLEGFENVGSADKPLDLNIKARGNFTRKGYSKKPFKLKLSKKQNLLGLTPDKSKHYAILAHADDEYGYMRNFVGFRLGEMIGLPWTPKQQPIEVVINGNYRGIYFLTESIRVGDGRVPITELADNATSPTDLTGGYLVELDNYISDCTFSLPDASNKNADPQYGSLMVTADTPEEYSDQQLRFIKEQFTKMNDLVNGNDDSELWSYLDLDDAARYYVVEEIISHYEAYHGSTYLYRDRASETDNGKWHFSPLWDCGHAFDGNPEQFFPDMQEYNNHTSYGNTWIGNNDGKGLRYKAKFMDKVKKTFQWFINKEVNNGKSPYEQLCEEINAYAANIATAAIADRERWKNAPKPDDIYWTDGSQPQPVVDNSNMTEKRDRVKSILEKKINWLKGQWGSEKLSEPARDTTPAAELPEYVKPDYTPQTREIYVINDKQTPWTNVYLWLYNSATDHLGGKDVSWPGVQMTFEEDLTVDGFKGVWHITVPEAYTSARAIFAESENSSNRYPADGADGMELNNRDMVFHTSNNSWTEPTSVVYRTDWSQTLPLVKIVTPSPATDVIGYGDEGAVKKCSFELDGLGLEGIANIATDAAGNVTIKGRGRTSWTEGGKNSYKLKFKDKVSVLGMPASKHWVLMSYSNDAANGLLTNYAGHELSRLIGLNWTPSMKPVELLINGEYMGLYFIAENVRAAADRVQIADYGDTAPEKKDYNMEHDFLLEFSDSHLDTDPEIYYEWASDNGFINKLITATPALDDIKDDKTVNADEVVATVMGHLDNHITTLQGAVTYAAQNPMSEDWAETIDAEQAAKYYIVQELMDDSRSFTNNFYIHHTWETDEAEGGVKGTKWFFGPVWDFSGAFTEDGNKSQLFHEAGDWGGTFIKDLYTNRHFVWIVGATFYKFVNGERMPEVVSQRMLTKGQNKVASIHDDYDPAMSYTLTDVNSSIDDMVDQIQDAVITDAARWPDYAAHSSESSLQTRAEAVKQKISQSKDYLARSISQGGAGWNLEDITTGIDDIIINSEDADAPAEYFDLMGRRIAAPQAGSIYIVRRGATVTKMIAK